MKEIEIAKYLQNISKIDIWKKMLFIYLFCRIFSKFASFNADYILTEERNQIAGLSPRFLFYII